MTLLVTVPTKISTGFRSLLFVLLLKKEGTYALSLHTKVAKLLCILGAILISKWDKSVWLIRSSLVSNADMAAPYSDFEQSQKGSLHIFIGKISSVGTFIR